MSVIEGRKLDPTDPKILNQAGYPLGRLRIALAITADQLRAGNEFSALVRSYARLNGIPLGSPKSGSMGERISSGFYTWGPDEIPEEESERRRQRINLLYNDCFAKLSHLGREHNRGHKIIQVVRDICVVEQDERQVWRDDVAIGDLRLGLNCLARCLIAEAIV